MTPRRPHLRRRIDVTLRSQRYVVAAPHLMDAFSCQRQKNAGERLKEWESHFPRLLAGMLRVEAHPLIPGGDCQRCGAPEGAVSCCNECADSLALCEQCIVAEHTHLPYHWILRWNGRYLVPTDLADVGYVRWLGHQGSPCPEQQRGGASPLEFVVVHTNGIHRCKIQPCACVGHSPLIDQALDAFLFPGTVELPQTLFTHDVLRDAHLDILTSKKPPHDYIRKLERKTKHATSGNVHVCFSPPWLGVV